MEVIRRRRRGPLITVATAVLVAAACFFLGLMATRFLAGHRPESVRMVAPLDDGTGAEAGTGIPGWWFDTP